MTTSATSAFPLAATVQKSFVNKIALEPLHVSLPRRLLLSLDSHNDLSSTKKGIYSLICILLVIGAGCASGLTLGLLSLSTLDLEVLKRSGTPREQRLAGVILPIISDTHWLLVTLLLCNAACFEALPIFLDVLVDPVAAILISVTAILLFGEILPQAVCVRHGLAVGAAMGWPVRIMMWVFSPIAWPLARILDKMLGTESYSIFKRKQLKALVDLHGADEGLGGKLSDDEVRIICGALDLTSKIAYTAMTPLHQVVMLSTDQYINKDTINTILASGHSRLPVYQGKNKTDIVGLLLVKELLHYAFQAASAPRTAATTAAADTEVDGEGGNKALNLNLHEICVKVSSIPLRPLPRLTADTAMYDMLRYFQTGRTHMVVLTQPAPTEGQEQQLILTPTGQRVTPPIVPGSPLSGTAPAVTVTQVPATLGAEEIQAHMETVEEQNGKKSWWSDFFKVRRKSSETGVSNRGDSKPGRSNAGFKRDSEMTTRNDTHLFTSSVPASVGTPRVHNGLPTHASDVEHQNGGENGHGRVSPGSATVPPTPTHAGTVSNITDFPARLAASIRALGTVSTSSTFSVPASDVPNVEIPLIAAPGQPIGILTIEDVLETLMDSEIFDETDIGGEDERTRFAQQLPERLRNIALATHTTATLMATVPGSLPRQASRGAIASMAAAAVGDKSRHGSAPLPTLPAPASVIYPGTYTGNPTAPASQPMEELAKGAE